MSPAKLVQHIRHWFADSGFRRLWKNTSILLTGSLASAGFDLVSLALTARALGAEQFGILVLIHSYVTVVDTIINFQSWQAIIKYGADALVQKRSDDLKSLIKFGTLLDAFSAVLGTAVAMAGVYWIGGWQEWNAETIQMAVAYSCVILFTLSSTPTAILRLFDKFHWLAGQRAGTAAIKAIALAVAFFAGGDLWTFVLIWMSMFIFGHLVIFLLGWFTLRVQGYRKVATASLKGVRAENPGIWKFVASTNLSSSIRLGAQEFDILIIGGLLGTAPAGIYKVAKQFGSIPTRLGDPLQQSIYPDMARLWAENSITKFRNYIFRIGSLAGTGGVMIWLAFLVFGEWILDTIVGNEYTEAYALLLVYMLGYVIYMFGIPFRPAILSMQHPERILLIYTGAHVVYFIVLITLLERIGVMGASIAQLVFHTCWFVAMVFSIIQYLRTTTIEPEANHVP